MFSWHHQDSAMFLLTKVCGELSLRIQQSLPRCNNRGAFQAHAGRAERQEAAKDAGKIVES
jgi:hypothetical protein